MLIPIILFSHYSIRCCVPGFPHVAPPSHCSRIIKMCVHLTAHQSFLTDLPTNPTVFNQLFSCFISLSGYGKL